MIQNSNIIFFQTPHIKMTIIIAISLLFAFTPLSNNSDLHAKSKKKKIEKNNAKIKIKLNKLKIINTVTNKMIPGIQRFKKTFFYSDRYIWSTRNVPGSKPLIVESVLYDVIAKKHITLPNIRNIIPQTLSRPPRSLKRAERNTFKSQQKLLEKWKWTGKIYSDLVDYNSEKKTVDIIQDRKRFINRAKKILPVCKCGGSAKFIEQYQRYYCNACKKYINEKEYISSKKEKIYFRVDLTNNKILWKALIPDKERQTYFQIKPLFVDQENQYFYYTQKSEQNPHAIQIRRLNLNTRKIDWSLNVAGKNKNFKYTWSRFFVSPDKNKLVFWDYDEKLSKKKKTRKGKTAPLIYVVNLAKKSSFELPGLATLYGYAFSRDSKTLLINSHQTGEAIFYNLENKKAIKKFKVSRNIFKWILDSDEKQLVGFSMHHIEIRNWYSGFKNKSNFKLIQKIKYERIFPNTYGVKKLLVTEQILETSNGSLAIIGIVKQKKGEFWASSDMKDGYHILQINAK